MIDPIQTESIDAIVKQYQARLPVTKDSDALIKDVLNEAYLAGRDRGTLAHPRYTKIEIEGRDRHYAIFHRKMRSQLIDVEVLTPRLSLENTIPADDLEMQLIGAKHIYKILEGYEPSTLGIDLYMRPIEQLANNYFRGNSGGRGEDNE